MAVLSRLPNELVLLVVEHACRGFNYTQPAWVASLCLVCKSVQLTVVPILYVRLFISTKTIHSLEELSLTDRNGRLSLVREVHLDDTLPLRNARSDGGCIVYYGIPSTLARALTGVNTVCGPSSSVESLAHLNPDLSATILSLHVTNMPYFWLPLARSRCFSALFTSVARLHMIAYFTNIEAVIERLSPLRGARVMPLNSLVFDIVFENMEIKAEEIARLHASLDFLIDIYSGCRRVLFRPHCDNPERTQFVLAQLTAWARGRKDIRICVDDLFAAIYNECDTQLELNVDDVLDGDSLWERGRPLWTPQADDCDA